jgi:hypothetical protein
MNSEILAEALGKVLTGCIEQAFVLPFHVVFLGINGASQIFRFEGGGIELDLLAEYETSDAVLGLPIHIMVCDTSVEEPKAAHVLIDADGKLSQLN